jgi:hypothetical protein
MADTKISALPASTTPLAGTEVLPIVQSSATKQVSVANLTAGRAISATQLTLSTGNLIPATAGKGVDFAANTGAAGMTSEILNWYEEGTWTPTDASGAGLSLTGTATNCFYTRIGNQVTCIFSLTYPSTVSAASATIGGLPFTSKNTGNSVAGGITTYISNGSVIVFLINSNDTIFGIRSIAGVSGVTNASLSTAQIRGIVQYLV